MAEGVYPVGRAEVPGTRTTPAEVEHKTAAEAGERGSLFEVLRVATRLGLTSFGGPVAHLGYFRNEYVVKRKWLSEKTYADLIALCQFLPGAASSKLGMSIGILRAGPLGGLVAWLGFTLPSAAALTGVALLTDNASPHTIDLLHGLKVVAVAVVAQAVWGMAKNLAPDKPRGTIAIAAAALVFILPITFGQLTIIAVSAVIGWRFLGSDNEQKPVDVPVPVPRWVGITCWVLFIALLAGLPILRSVINSQSLAMGDSFYRSGALVFGGGHVVLPLLQSQVVPPDWISKDHFLTGYGFAQAVPGPLFTFAAYLGTAMNQPPNGVAGAALALVAIFLPSMLLTYGALPWWSSLRGHPAAQAALRGVNAAVVGILLAALYSPVFTSSILRPADFVLALAAFGLLMIWKCPPWIVVLFSGIGGALIATLG
ncbi:MAG TPA: chromate efflux transporter [Jatrophihabitans sp.]|nr:chromate efflux transporter [Jatrophihabitans sp.]